MIEASCHCRAVVLELAELPTHVFECNWRAADRMGVNARLVDGLSKNNARLHHLDGASTGAFWT